MSHRKDDSQSGLSRRTFVKTASATAIGFAVPGFYGMGRAFGVPLAPGLSDPALQPKFVEPAPNALNPRFVCKDFGNPKAARPYFRGKAARPNFRIKVAKTRQRTGLINPKTGRKLTTDLYGYGQTTVSWPGPTIQVRSVSGGGADETIVQWVNALSDRKHLLPLDTTLHWCYSLPGYTRNSIRRNGIPIITHLHGGQTDFQFDGNPEFFYSPNNRVVGPQWDSVPGGFTNVFRYDNDVPAGNLWYHDHALGITRLNVYAGLAGFYFIRDEFDTGATDNPLGLPAFPYELAYAIQDRMFSNNGALFYPAFVGDPGYADVITDEGVVLGPPEFPINGGPTVLTEFFGDHIVVNGTIWPKTDVEPRHYRLRLLNGSDSRFLVIQFVAVNADVTDPNDPSVINGTPLPFDVIGSDQGLASVATTTDTLVFENGSRYDIVFDFSDVALSGKRIIMKNIAWDAPFSGDFGRDDPDAELFPDSQTGVIMAFDVTLPMSAIPDNYNPGSISFGPVIGAPTVVRKVALFEGKDEFGRLQPLLGTVDPAPNEFGSEATPYPWFQPTTETPTIDTVEEWEIFNFTPDAHPMHVHLVNFQVLGRNVLTFDSDDGDPGQPVIQHNGTEGRAPIITDIAVEVR
ncbi:MAG: multicopper oxidase domain-containing protein [Rhodospirillales bacterium]|nr:multicopper oxidase domain-containing protein [Rhodospirillales bacterium]